MDCPFDDPAAIVSVAAPIFNEQVFSVVIPNADKALMVQVFFNGAVSALLNVVTLVPATVMMCVYSSDAVKWFLPILVVLVILETAAAEAAAVADDIRAMPMQMQTILSEGGLVSGGQRQRIMIARALARKPRILILDEATSALDNASQRVVTETFAKLKDVTKIVIAHRFSTIRSADRIYVLDGGRVAEEGTFDELMAKGGLFTTLAKRQL